MKKRKKTNLFVLLGFMAMTMTLASCQVVNAPSDSNNPGNEPTSSHNDENVTAVSAKVVIPPNKTSYFPGETFDITGLSVEVTMSNQTTENYFDTDFTNWTHKDEPLTEEVKEIEVDVPNSTLKIKVTITVGIGDAKLLLDTSKIKESYVVGDKIDLTTIVVRLSQGGKVSNLTNNDWTIYDGDTQITDLASYEPTSGEHTLTVKYGTALTASFAITVNEPNAVIYPSTIEAEDSIFKLNQGEETDEKISKAMVNGKETSFVNSSSSAEYFNENNKSVQQWGIYNGASGKGSVEKLTNIRNQVYFKFKVNVPQDGSYQLFARVQRDTSGASLTFKEGAFKVAAGEGTEVSSNEFTLYPANQLKDYVDTKGVKYSSYYNMLWWSFVKFGDLNLTQGENTIKIKIDSNLTNTPLLPNIDFFEVKENDYAVGDEIYSMRSKTPVDLAKNNIYLTQGEKLTDMCTYMGTGWKKTPLDSRCPTEYAYIYVRLADGREIPVLPSMLNIDYEKLGEQEVTATIKNLTLDQVEATKTFKVVIQENTEE